MNPVKTSVSLVLIGQFEPNNFIPKKLAEGKVISQKASELASYISLVPEQNIQFSLDWVEVLVVKNRFQVVSLEAPHIRICDLALKALCDLAPTSLVSQFGVNVECHFDMESVGARNQIGVRLAPPEAWGVWGKVISDTMSGQHQGTPLQGGVVHIQMRLPFQDNEVGGWHDISVLPSTEVKSGFGVLMRSNFHYQIANSDSQEALDKKSDNKSTSQLLSALANNFEKSIDNALSIFEEVLSTS
jgi:hypothetical protein